MTRKHYHHLALVLAEVKPVMPEQKFRWLLTRIAEVLSDDNALFDRTRFYRAADSEYPL
jgi:hypothetical protein